MHKRIYPFPLSKQEWTNVPRVAVIDTGIDLTHRLLEPYLESGELAGWRDFINEKAPNKIEDLEGHGTHVSHLLLRTASPYIRLYHARVFKISDADDNTALLVAKVMLHLLHQRQY